MTKPFKSMQGNILEYYQTQGLPLNKVMQIMTEKHNFTASQRAYRQQFQKWGVFKYNRKSRAYPASNDQQRFPQARSDMPVRYSSGHHHPGYMPYPEAYSPRGPAYPSSQLGLLPLPKPGHTNQYSMGHHMPMSHSSPSSSDSTDTSPYWSYRPLDTKQAYHDTHHGLDSLDSLDGKSRYPSLESSPHHSVSYSHSYYNQATSPGSSPSDISTGSTDQYRSCNSGCCCHEQSSVDQGCAVPLARSDSRSSYSPMAPYPHHNS